MIIWIASYPKSGNTWLRSFICSYYFTDKGSFNFELLRNIEQYPQKKFFSEKITKPGEISNYWKESQKKIIQNKKNYFFKTHNNFMEINGKSFTDTNLTLGVVYIIRDPRNVITSINNHFNLDYKESLKFMINERKYIHDDREDDYADFHFLSSWSNHYKSWVNAKEFNKLVIKYEDLERNTYNTFFKIINFLNKLLKINDEPNKKKIQNSINATNFENLKKLEKKYGFNESVVGGKTKEKINFFNMGSSNQWEKVIPEEYHYEINKSFENDLNFLGYN